MNYGHYEQPPEPLRRMQEFHLCLDGTWTQTCACGQTFSAPTATDVQELFDTHECWIGGVR